MGLSKILGRIRFKIRKPTIQIKFTINCLISLCLLYGFKQRQTPIQNLLFSTLFVSFWSSVIFKTAVCLFFTAMFARKNKPQLFLYESVCIVLYMLTRCRSSRNYSSVRIHPALSGLSQFRHHSQYSQTAGPDTRAPNPVPNSSRYKIILAHDRCVETAIAGEDLYSIYQSKQSKYWEEEEEEHFASAIM